MFRRRRRRVRINEIPQASLPDLAFLLLIFFITSADIPIEHGLPLLLPSASRSARLEVQASDVFRIRNYPGGQVTVDGVVVPLDRIGELLRNRNAGRRRDGEEALIVVIETHPEADYALMVAVLDQVQGADSRRVSLQMLQEAP